MAATGHGSQILIADANYAHATNVHPGADVVYLNLRPGLVGIDDILTSLLDTVPVESVVAMRPDDGSVPACWAGYEQLLGPEIPLRPIARLEFYQTCRRPDVALCIASGDTRHYANLLLTVGFLPESPG
ncbi:RbsD/FucU domain-containing protein [Amycolatopsis sp. RTGN1]|uniref:RbsD/FucU domain-containing protein n=1 Tax=Amycolatopsis ponsaeliensis TaxID=2992142 RepID=UPI00254A4974|nr:RbsD/FucU domain-containing protein [Amycolatopsis sp. RTGN1]